MLNITRRLPSPINQICKRCRASVAAQSTDTERVADKWQLFVSACIIRPPIVNVPLTSMEEEFKEVVMKKEVEEAYQSNHELRILKDIARKKILQTKTASKSTNLIFQKSEETAGEYEDRAVVELKNFKFSPIITEADNNGDIHSLNRAFDRSLVLVSHEKLGEKKSYLLPQITLKSKENLRQACDRLVSGNVNPQLRVKIFGNAPCGFYHYKYSKALRDEVNFIGAKVFFYSGHVMNMDFNILDKIRSENNCWLTHDQLGDKLDRSYHNAIKNFLIDDN